MEIHHQSQAPQGKAASKTYRSPSYASSLASSRRASNDHDGDDVSLTGMTDDEETGLTKDEQKERRRRRKMSYPAQDDRAGLPIAKGWLSLADVEVLKKSGVNAVLIGLWYLFSVSISVYNKWMFSPKNLNFQFPLFTTSVHMLVQFALASLVLLLVPRLRPSAGRFKPHDPHNSVEEEPETKKSSAMTWAFYLTRLGPCGAATGLDIGLGNMSLRFLTLTFYTMCKSSVLAFVLFWAFIFRLESPSVKLILIIGVMIVGVTMMAAAETTFSLIGFVLIISSAFFSGFRWAITQILLLKNPSTSNPFSSIFYLAPVMFLSLFVLAVPIEGFGPLSEGLSKLFEAKGTLNSILLLLFPGTLAFCMVASEFALLQRTSVVTLSVCGIFKEVVMITASELVYHDEELTPVNIGGLLLTMSAIATYNYMKIVKMRESVQEQLETQGTVKEAEPMLAGGEEGVGRASPPKTTRDLD